MKPSPPLPEFLRGQFEAVLGLCQSKPASRDCQGAGAWTGLWRISEEWGPVYCCAMTDCNEASRPVHHGMPVILSAADWDTWLHGSFDDLCAFQQWCYLDELIGIERTTDSWHKRPG